MGGRRGFRVFIAILEGVSLDNSEPSMVIVRRVLLIMCKRTNLVDKPDTFVETNLAQMPAYAVYRGTTPDGSPAFLTGGATTDN